MIFLYIKNVNRVSDIDVEITTTYVPQIICHSKFFTRLFLLCNFNPSTIFLHYFRPVQLIPEEDLEISFLDVDNQDNCQIVIPSLGSSHSENIFSAFTDSLIQWTEEVQRVGT